MFLFAKNKRYGWSYLLCMYSDVEYNLIAFMQFAGVCPQGNRQIDFTVETFDVIIPVMIECQV